MSYMSEKFKLDLSPVANPEAVVTGKTYVLLLLHPG